MPKFNVSVTYYGTIIVEAETANEAEELVRQYDLSDAEINDVSFGDAYLSEPSIHDDLKKVLERRINNGTHT